MPDTTILKFCEDVIGNPTVVVGDDYGGDVMFQYRTYDPPTLIVKTSGNVVFLSQGQVAQLLPYLQHFADTGTLPTERIPT